MACACSLVRPPFRCTWVVDDGKIALLEADHAVGAFVHGRQCVGLVARLCAEALDCKVAERDFALHAAQRDRAVPQQLPGMSFGAVGMFGFRIADHFGSVDADDDVTAAHRNLEAEPLAVLGQRAVKVAHGGERTALACPVDGSVAENHLVARLAVGVEEQRRLGTGLREGFPRKAEVTVVACSQERPARRYGWGRGADLAFPVVPPVERPGSAVVFAGGERGKGQECRGNRSPDTRDRVQMAKEVAHSLDFVIMRFRFGQAARPMCTSNLSQSLLAIKYAHAKIHTLLEKYGMTHTVLFRTA